MKIQVFHLEIFEKWFVNLKIQVFGLKIKGCFFIYLFFFYLFIYLFTHEKLYFSTENPGFSTFNMK